MGQPNQEGSSAYRAVPGGAGEQSGALLLVEAYSAIWVLVFALILWTLRRQRQMNARIASLERELQRVRDESDAAQPPDGVADGS